MNTITPHEQQLRVRDIELADVHAQLMMKNIDYDVAMFDQVELKKQMRIFRDAFYKTQKYVDLYAVLLFVTNALWALAFGWGLLIMK